MPELLEDADGAPLPPVRESASLSRRSMAVAELESPHRPVTISLIARLDPLGRPTGEDFTGDLEAYAKSFCAYVAENLERFADQRGGDTFVAVVLERGDEKASQEFRSGHFVTEAAPDG